MCFFKGSIPKGLILQVVTSVPSNDAIYMSLCILGVDDNRAGAVTSLSYDDVRSLLRVSSVNDNETGVMTSLTDSYVTDYCVFQV